MKLELAFLVGTGALLYNYYYDGKLQRLLMRFRKGYQMLAIAFAAICLYATMKKGPNAHQTFGSGHDALWHYSCNAIRAIPMSQETTAAISSVFDLTDPSRNFMQTMYPDAPHVATILPTYVAAHNLATAPAASDDIAANRSGSTPGSRHKRVVSETKKKYVAYNQDWKCAACNNKLSYTFEVDHRVRLDQGGSNDVDNLMALCRECHGRKTAKENMGIL